MALDASRVPPPRIVVALVNESLGRRNTPPPLALWLKVVEEVDGERLQGGMRVEKWIEERKEHPRHRGEEIIRGRDGKESEDKKRLKKRSIRGKKCGEKEKEERREWNGKGKVDRGEYVYIL